MEISSIYKELSIIVLGALPVSEVRGAIPTAILIYQFPLWKAYLLAVLGNTVAGLLLLIFLKYFARLLADKSYLWNRFFAWLFERTKKKHAGHFNHYKYALPALFIFVAIPLPLTGAWSAAVAAIIFDIPLRSAALAITAGIAAAGIIVTILSYAGFIAAQAAF